MWLAREVPLITNTMTDDDEELLAVTAVLTSRSDGHMFSSLEALQEAAKDQKNPTSTFWGKAWQFLRIQFLRYPNRFEQYVRASEPNDCSLVAKYASVVEIDLRHQDLLVESLSLVSMHIPHPLVNFMRNDANKQQAETLNVQGDLQESPVLFFIHGLGGQMSQFEPLMGLLSQCLEIMAVDLPGFGNSRRSFEQPGKSVTILSEEQKQKVASSVLLMSTADYSTNNIVSILYEYVSQQIPLGKKVVLVGHSMGTHLAVKLAKNLPAHKVEGLVLLSPAPFADNSAPQPSNILASMRAFARFSWLFNCFRVWDRLEGLESRSVVRQLAKDNTNIYNSLRQLRWNLDIDTSTILKYIEGFHRSSYSDLVTAVRNFNDRQADNKTYEKTLFVGGTDDIVTPCKVVHETDYYLTKTFGRQVSRAIEIPHAGHSLLLVKPEYISGMILNHIESKFPERLHLSPAWVLQVKAKISGDKWGLKNEQKWLDLQPISDNITRNDGTETAPLLGMKTLREGDSTHSPQTLENLFYSGQSHSHIRGTLVSIIDISADIPPYSPKNLSHITYYKCATVSKVVPDQGSVRRFVQLVDDILSNCEVKEPLIAVHCHYGFNRTGFLICCYLIERLGWTVREAVDGFRAARSPGIKHPHFIDALYVRYE